MNEFVEELRAQVSAELYGISVEPLNQYQRAEKSYYVVQAAIQKLKSYVGEHGFESEEDEIAFFKQIKPTFLKDLLYFKEQCHIEANWPVGSKGAVRKYLLREIKQIGNFFRKEHSFYNYYRSGKSHYDRLFYLRAAENDILQPEYDPDMDDRFSTVHSSKLARFMALEQLNEYLLQCIQKLNSPSPEIKTRFKWTDSKVSLIELAYAIFARRSVNSGGVEIKEIMDLFQQMFQIDLGNYYGVFNQNIRIRKKNRTTYIGQLEDDLVRYMDELDENPRQQRL